MHFPEGSSLHIDFETFNESPIVNGTYKYAEHPSCEVLILCYKFHIPGRRTKVKRWVPFYDPKKGKFLVPHNIEISDDHPYRHLMEYHPPVKREGRGGLNLARHVPMPDDLVAFIENTDMPVYAHNSQFEQRIWREVMVPVHGAPEVADHRWRCTAIMSAASGLPRSLEHVGQALQLPIQKDKEGSRLIRIFCIPRKPTKANPATRIYPWDQPQDFDRFCQYCETDVETELGIVDALPVFHPPEWAVVEFDIKMNNRGLPLDVKAVRNGYRILTELESDVKKEVEELTGGVRPTQVAKFKESLASFGLEMENLQAKTIKDLITLRGDDLDPKAKRLLQLRVEGGKASTKKLKTMLSVMCRTKRIHGAFLLYGAHTGRWSGKLVQPQNFIRGEYKPHHWGPLFGLIHKGDPDDFRWLYEWPIDALAQGMRGYICAPEGKKFVVCDFSAIEARVLAWLAREMKTIDLYLAGKDLYKALAVKLYNLKSESEVADGQRKFAKDVFLGCGYQLGGPGFQKNCMERGIVIDDDFAQKAVDTYREDNPNIVQLWYDVQEAAHEAVETCATHTNPVYLRNLAFYVEDKWFCIKLPSGRSLRYFQPRLSKQYPWVGVKSAVEKAFFAEGKKRPTRAKPARFKTLKFFFDDPTPGKAVVPFIIVNSKGERKHTTFPEAYLDKLEAIETTHLTYMSFDSGKFFRNGTYGGKLVENIVQAIARDLMVASCLRAERKGYEIIGTVHDELIAEVPEDFGSAEELLKIMCVKPKWATDAPINAEGWEGKRYRK